MKTSRAGHRDRHGWRGHAWRFVERYDGALGTTYFIRPDQYVAGRWRSFDSSKIERALAA